MNILFISKVGDSLSLAMRVKEEGHNCFFYTLEKRAERVGEGLVERVKSLRVANERGEPAVRNINLLLKKVNPDLVVFDMVKLGKVADYIRSLNYPVFGASLWADNAELDRWYGYKLMKAVGIKTPPTFKFKAGEYKRAINFVGKTKKRYVYKPSGNIDAAHTYVARGVDDLVAMLELWKDDRCEFELQEFVEGVELSCELWWNGFEAELVNMTFEEKKFMNGGIGCAIGCAGNVVKKVEKEWKLVKEGVGRMERLLKRTKYRGPIDLNSIVNEEGLWGLEFTVRFGYDAVQTLLELYRGSVTRLLYNIATGVKVEGELSDDYAIGVRLSIPPYPHSEDAVEGVPIIGLSRENMKHIWLGDVRKEGKRFVSAGVDGCVGCVTARGRDVKECRRRVYRTISNLVIPQVQYRTDIGERVKADLSQLKKWGYLLPPTH